MEDKDFNKDLDNELDKNSNNEIDAEVADEVNNEADNYGETDLFSYANSNDVVDEGEENFDLNAFSSKNIEEEALAETATATVESIHRELGQEGFSLENILADEHTEERMVEHIALQQALEKLPEKENTVIKLRYFHGLTQDRVSKVLGVSQVQISRIEKKAIKTLRLLLSSD